MVSLANLRRLSLRLERDEGIRPTVYMVLAKFLFEDRQFSGDRLEEQFGARHLVDLKIRRTIRVVDRPPFVWRAFRQPEEVAAIVGASPRQDATGLGVDGMWVIAALG